MTATMETLFEKNRLILERIKKAEEEKGPTSEEVLSLKKELQELAQSMSKMNKVLTETASKLLKG